MKLTPVKEIPPRQLDLTPIVEACKMSPGTIIRVDHDWTNRRQIDSTQSNLKRYGLKGTVSKGILYVVFPKPEKAQAQAQAQS
jgi:hypothetical protein